MESFSAAAEVPYRNHWWVNASPPFVITLPCSVAVVAVRSEELSVSMVGAATVINCRVSPDDVPLAFFATAAMYHVPGGVSPVRFAVKMLSGTPTTAVMVSFNAVREVPYLNQRSVTVSPPSESTLPCRIADEIVIPEMLSESTVGGSARTNARLSWRFARVSSSAAHR